MNPQQLARKEVDENKQMLEKRLAASLSGVSGHLECEPKLTHTDGTFVVRARIRGTATQETKTNPVVRCEGHKTFGELALKPTKDARFQYEASFPAKLIGVDYHGARLVLYPSSGGDPVSACRVWVVEQDLIKNAQEKILKLYRDE